MTSTVSALCSGVSVAPGAICSLGSYNVAVFFSGARQALHAAIRCQSQQAIVGNTRSSVSATCWRQACCRQAGCSGYACLGATPDVDISATKKFQPHPASPHAERMLQLFMDMDVEATIPNLHLKKSMYFLTILKHE